MLYLRVVTALGINKVSPWRWSFLIEVSRINKAKCTSTLRVLLILLLNYTTLPEDQILPHNVHNFLFEKPIDYVCNEKQLRFTY